MVSPPLVLTMGDPAGCGPQITVETWRTRDMTGVAAFYVIGDPRLYEPHIPVTRIDRPNDAIAAFATALPVLPIEIDAFDALQAGTPFPPSAAATIESIRRATADCLSGHAAALVTNPIAKSVLYGVGFDYPGHTEFIAALCGPPEAASPRPVMMLVGGGLRVALATIHVPLMRVLDHLTPDLLEDVTQITHAALQRDFGVANPRIALTGLNPHAGEDGNIGTEERDLINPLAARLRQRGIDVSDARSADTLFHEARSGKYDAVIAMTHDQGLIPVKTLDMWGGVNTTLGLPIVRTSPDHGTAFEAAAEGTCRPDSLIAAIRLAQDMASHKARPHA